MARDFRAEQIQTKQIIASGTLADGSGAKLVIYPVDKQDASSPNQGVIDQNAFATGALDGQDVFLFVSGGISERNSSNRSISVFGGDLFSSGTIIGENGFSGSLTALSDGKPYLIAGTGITFATNSLGQVEITGSATATLESAINASSPDNDVIIPSSDPVRFTDGGVDGFPVFEVVKTGSGAGEPIRIYNSGSDPALYVETNDTTEALVLQRQGDLLDRVSFYFPFSFTFAIQTPNNLNILLDAGNDNVQFKARGGTVNFNSNSDQTITSSITNNSIVGAINEIAGYTLNDIVNAPTPNNDVTIPSSVILRDGGGSVADVLRLVRTNPSSGNALDVRHSGDTEVVRFVKTGTGIGTLFYLENAGTGDTLVTDVPDGTLAYVARRSADNSDKIHIHFGGPDDAQITTSGDTGLTLLGDNLTLGTPNDLFMRGNGGSNVPFNEAGDLTVTGSLTSTSVIGAINELADGTHRFPANLSDITTDLTASDRLLGFDDDQSELVNISPQRLFNAFHYLDDATTDGWGVDNSNDEFLVWDNNRSAAFRASFGNAMFRALRYFHERPEHTTISDGDRIPWFDDTSNEPVHALASTLAQYVHDYINSLVDLGTGTADADKLALYDADGGAAKSIDLSDLAAHYGLDSAAYSPTFTADTSVSSIDATFDAHYLQIGDHVWVFGRVTVTASTTSGVIALRVTLPTSGSFTTVDDVYGHTLSVHPNFDGKGDVIADTTNNEAKMRWRVTATASIKLDFVFRYVL